MTIKLIEPAATENLVTNPSLEKDTTGWTTGGTNTIARSADEQAFGAWSLKATYQDNLVLARFAITLPTADTRYIFSAWAFIPADYDGDEINLGGQGLFSGSTVQETASDRFLTDKGEWRRLRMMIDVAADLTGELRVNVSTGFEPTAGKFIYIDGVQIEEASTITTNCDGDQDGCEWTGTPHASTSTRAVTVRAGGIETDLEADLGLKTSRIIGAGAPDLAHLTQPLGVADGALLQRVRALPATITIRGTVREADRAAVHTTRRAIMDAVKPDRVPALEPVTLIYDGSGTELEIPAHYAAGLEGLVGSEFHDDIALQMIAYDPRWRARIDEGVALAHETTLTLTRMAARINGAWSNLNGTANAGVTDYVRGRDGLIYVSGAFTEIGGVTTTGIARYDPVADSWESIGSMSSSGNALAVDGQGGIIVGGSFTTVDDGAVAADRIARYDPDSDTWEALGSGLNATVEDVALAADGTLWVVGGFSTAGGNSALGVATWDGATWSDVAAVDLLGGGVVPRVIEIAPDGDVWVGGEFTVASGADFNFLVRYDGTAWAEQGAFEDEVKALAFDDGGNLYAGGDFDDIDGLTVNRIAKWNGSSWVALGEGVERSSSPNATSVHTITVDADGLVIVGGDFDTAGSLTDLVGHMAAWNGSTWVHADLALPTSNIDTVRAVAGDLYIGGGFNGTATAPGVTTVTPSGSSETGPVIRITGPGRVLSLRNLTSGADVFMDLTLLEGEELTFDLRPGRITVESTFRGNLVRHVLAGSDLVALSLGPGDNRISVLVADDDTATEASMWWRARHWGAE